MRPFILDQKIRKELLALRAYAKANPVSMDDMLDTMNNDKVPIGDDPNHVWHSQFGFRLVVSLEEHSELELYHISVSVPEAEKLPSTHVVSMMLAAMGFSPEHKDWYKIKIEDLGDNYEALNIWVQ